MVAQVLRQRLNGGANSAVAVAVGDTFVVSRADGTHRETTVLAIGPGAALTYLACRAFKGLVPSFFADLKSLASLVEGMAGESSTVVRNVTGRSSVSTAATVTTDEPIRAVVIA